MPLWVCVCVCVRGRTVMLLSITSDNSRLPEAFATNTIKSFLFINVTKWALQKDEQPHVFVADASSQLRVCVSSLLSLNCVHDVLRFNIQTWVLIITRDVIKVDLICEIQRITAFIFIETTTDFI